MPKAVDFDAIVARMLEENARRSVQQHFDPLTGEGMPGERVGLSIGDFPFPVQRVPARMSDTPIYKALHTRSIRAFLAENGILPSDPGYEDERERVIKQVIYDRCKALDFPFWCALMAYIKPKDGGDDIRFILRRPQRRLAQRLCDMVAEGRPIRIVMLKARQWGGSTEIQLFMCYIQLVLEKGLNSNIVSHEKTSSAEIKDMFYKLMEHYPDWMLYGPGVRFDAKEPKTVGSKDTPNITKVPARNAKVKIGTAERPDTARGGDTALVHCSEVAFWRKTEGKEPADIVRSACAGALYRPLTMIVYESTARGRDNFFHDEYQDAKEHRSQFDAFFVPWYEIEFCSLDPTKVSIGDSFFKSKADFCVWLWENKLQTKAPNRKAEPGCYLWSLWTKYKCTVENIAWYVMERTKYGSHAEMAAENPTDDVEAFASTSTAVFDSYALEHLEKGCTEPRMKGEVTGAAVDGPDALRALRFAADESGDLEIWAEPDTSLRIANRYLVIVDVGGRSATADFSDILVMDRAGLLYGDGPEVVAEWHGHIRHDLLAWKAAQTAAWYDNALLVIESNTLETKDKERDLDGDLTEYILELIANVYDNLYTRPASAEKITKGIDREYGWHTNVSTKPAIIQNLVAAVEEGAYAEKSHEAITEMSYYEKRLDGTYGNVPGNGRHDDRVMTRAIGLYVSQYKMDPPSEKPNTEEEALPSNVLQAMSTLI